MSASAWAATEPSGRRSSAWARELVFLTMRATTVTGMAVGTGWRGHDDDAAVHAPLAGHKDAAIRLLDRRPVGEGFGNRLETTPSGETKPNEVV